MFYTYILLSEKTDKTYTGSTNNVERRLAEHNAGQSKYTKRFRPWRLFYTEKFSTLKEAKLRERYFKSCAGRRSIKKIFDRSLNSGVAQW